MASDLSSRGRVAALVDFTSIEKYQVLWQPHRIVPDASGRRAVSGPSPAEMKRVLNICLERIAPSQLKVMPCSIWVFVVHPPEMVIRACVRLVPSSQKYLLREVATVSFVQSPQPEASCMDVDCPRIEDNAF